MSDNHWQITLWLMWFGKQYLHYSNYWLLSEYYY